MKSKMNEKELLLLYGSGGHNEEARRLLDSINPYLPEYSFISLCDDDVKYILTEKFYKIPTVTDKYSYFKVALKIPYTLYRAVLIFKKIQKNHNIKYAITTGPGISVILAPILKFYKIPIIYIENGCRFYSKSLSGRIMYYLSTHFFIQNTELLTLYPKAVFKGRL